MDAWVHLNVAEPIVAWHAYRGVLQSAPTVHEELITPWMVVALRAAAEARHDWWVRRERIIEETRASTTPAAVSRLTGFFAFPDHATAEDRVAAWGWEHTNLAQIDIGQGAKISRHDSQWIEQMGTSPQVSQAEAYVRGDAFNSTPKWELLVAGSARILGTTLRMRALEVVREVWPGSLFFAEIGRLGALLGENAGYMSPQLFNVDGPHVGVRWLMADVPTAPEFARKIRELIANTPNGELNFQAIGDIDGPDLRLPDTRAMEFRLPRAYAERLLDW